MVNIAIQPVVGTNSTKYFPHSGYLGLSPVKVEGTILITPDDSGRPLPATQLSVSVRCYEARVGRAGISRTVVLLEHSQVLWSKNPDVDYESISELTIPFKIVLPASIGGYSTLTLPDYRIFWKLDAVLSHVPQIAARDRLYKSYNLRLVRYDAIPLLPTQSTSTSRHERLWNYQISVPSDPYGPTDIIPVHVSWQSRDPSIHVLSIKLLLERHLILLESASPTISQSPQLLNPLHSSNNDRWEDSSRLSRCSSSTSLTSTIRSDAPLLTPPTFINRSSGPPASLLSKLIAAEVTKSLVTAPIEGTFSKTIPLALPAVKSAGHWQQGFTCSGVLASVQFFLRGQIVLTSNGRNEVIDIEPIEVNLVATNQSERSVAQAKVDSIMLANSRSNSKSPLSIRSHRPLRHGTESPPRSDERDGSIGLSLPQSSKKSSRRPHTSSGPTRESKSIFSSNVTLPDRNEHRSSFQPSPLFSPLSPPSSFRLRSKSKSRPSSGVKQGSKEGSSVKSWEQDLDRVASQSSKRSAEMLRYGRPPIPVSPVHTPTDHGRGTLSIRSTPVVIAAVSAS